jgi:predicted RNA-binding Zn-ribbon protein involved in translation (DUF1610 family)
LDGLASGWETAVERLSEKLALSREGMETAENRAQERALAVGEQLEEMKKKIAGRNDWEEQQWGELGTQLQWEEKELKEIKQGVDSLVRENRKERKRKEGEDAASERAVMEAGLAQMRAAPRTSAPAMRHSTPPPNPPNPAPPPGPPAPAVPEVTMADVEEEIEEFSDMEGVQREGLYDSQHAPPPEEPDYMASQEGHERREKGEATRTKTEARRARETARKEKGKNKEVVGVTREDHPRVILKRPETAAAEAAADAARWGRGSLSVIEQEIYGRASTPILAESPVTGAATETRDRTKRAHQAGMEALRKWVEEGRPQLATLTAAPRTAIAPRTTMVPRSVVAPRTAAAPRITTVPRTAAAPQAATALSAPQQQSWAQRAAEAVALPETGMQRVGKKGRPVKEPTGLEPIKGSIPPDERRIVFERAAGAPQIDARIAGSVAGLVNVALSKVAPAHVRTEVCRISDRGTLTTTARFGASAAMLLHFKKEIIEAARKADNTIINVIACVSWVELKILVPYDLYRGKNGLGPLREAIEAENEGVVIPPFSMKWMRAWRHNEELWRKGELPRGRASVIFKVPNKAAGLGLLKEIWVAGNRFQAEIYVPSKADSICSICSMWGHSEFRCYSRMPACGICAGGHRTAEHRCDVVTCGRQGRACEHTTIKCPNCGEAHLAQDRRCRTKMAAIGIAKGNGYPPPSQARIGVPQGAGAPRMRAETGAQPPAADWTETEEERAPATATADNAKNTEDSEMISSGSAPPMTQ